MMVQCCSDLHAVHWGGKSVASHLLCESHRDLPPLPHHDALHHLPHSLQVILLDAKYNYKYIFQTGARLMQNTNTNKNTYSRLEHPHFGIGGGEEKAGLAKVEDSEIGPRQVMPLWSRHISFMERVEIFSLEKRPELRDDQF